MNLELLKAFIRLLSLAGYQEYLFESEAISVRLSHSEQCNTAESQKLNQFMYPSSDWIE
ncbi:MAG: hypothetical protein ACI9G1_004422 [Pirellulaceae bacterium]|jgi:hypothetical protein